jgi:hypothetical protein
LDPTFARPWNAKGYSLSAEGRYREALDAYEKAIELEPGFAYAWNGKGYMLGAEGQYPEALAAYRRAIELDPRFAYPWNGIGSALTAMGQPREALDAYNKAIDLDPIFAVPWFGKAVLLKANPELAVSAGHSAQQCFCRAAWLCQTQVQEFPLPKALLLDVVGEFPLCLLAYRLVVESGIAADDSRYVSLFDRVMRESKPPLALLAAVNSDPALTGENKALFSGMIHYSYGDPIRAFDCFDAVDSSDDGNLAGQYYLVLSLKECGEAIEKEMAFALGRAGTVLQDRSSSVSARQLYYAGLLFSLANEMEKAVQCFVRNGRHLPSLCMRWFCLHRQRDPLAESVRTEVVQEERCLVRQGERGYLAPVLPEIDPARPGWLADFQFRMYVEEIKPAVQAMALREVSIGVDAGPRSEVSC